MIGDCRPSQQVFGLPCPSLVTSSSFLQCSFKQAAWFLPCWRQQTSYLAVLQVWPWSQPVHQEAPVTKTNEARAGRSPPCRTTASWDNCDSDHTTRYTSKLLHFFSLPFLHVGQAGCLVCCHPPVLLLWCQTPLRSSQRHHRQHQQRVPLAGPKQDKDKWMETPGVPGPRAVDVSSRYRGDRAQVYSRLCQCFSWPGGVGSAGTSLVPGNSFHFTVVGLNFFPATSPSCCSQLFQMTQFSFLSALLHRYLSTTGSFSETLHCQKSPLFSETGARGHLLGRKITTVKNDIK